MATFAAKNNTRESKKTELDEIREEKNEDSLNKII